MNTLPSLRLPRGGMQIHAVPENERYVDTSGKRLPWAYERSDNEMLQGKRDPVEQGPFGRSNRRRGTSRSRSKTAEPRKEEDIVKAENAAAEDAIFGRLRVDQREKESDSNAVTSTAKPEAKEPTEILLYGFGEDLMWAAIDFFERVSNGIILEDYERQPPGRQEPLSRSLSRATAQKSLTRASLRRKNTFVGGAHWIKVTLDSAEAADLAVARSPHTIKGHLVYAEMYRGSGPAKDEAIFASSAGAQITSDLPKTFKIDTSPAPSNTVSSATIDQPQAVTTSRQQDTPVRRPARITGATQAMLLPAEQALLPRNSRQWWSQPKASNAEVMLPRRDGAFDWEKAGIYWQICWWIDFLLGTDLCGLKGED